MQQGFDFLHAACERQRHLLIAVECLQHQLEDRKHGESSQNETLLEELIEQIVELSASMATNVEKLIQAQHFDAECITSSQPFQSIEGVCRQLLDANLFVVQTALAVIGRYGHAPWTTSALNNIATRTHMIHAQLCEYVASSKSTPSRAKNSLSGD